MKNARLGVPRWAGLIGLFLLLPLLLNACGSGVDESSDGISRDRVSGSYWDSPNAPLRGERNFGFLMNNFRQGKPRVDPWASSWWPFKYYGVANGYFNFGNLSPAGKYDAVRGKAFYAQDWEAYHHGPLVPYLEPWWGHCNGWSGAAALFPEPQRPVRVNGVVFTVADIKALLSEAAMAPRSEFFGNRVRDAREWGGPRYRDVVPGQFFLILTHFMGLQQRTVVIDQDTGPEVWNQPLAGYRFERPTRADYVGLMPGSSSIYGIRLTARIWWMRDNVWPGVTTPPFDFPGSDTDTVESRSLKLELWVDAPIEFDASDNIVSSGNVVVQSDGKESWIGGRWLEVSLDGARWFPADDNCKQCWPDFMWVPYGFNSGREYEQSSPSQEEINPYVDLDWIVKYLLGPSDEVIDPAGLPEPNVRPAPPIPLPSPSPSPSPSRVPDVARGSDP